MKLFFYISSKLKPSLPAWIAKHSLTSRCWSIIYPPVCLSRSAAPEQECFPLGCVNRLMCVCLFIVGQKDGGDIFFFAKIVCSNAAKKQKLSVSLCRNRKLSLYHACVKWYNPLHLTHAVSLRSSYDLKSSQILLQNVCVCVCVQTSVCTRCLYILFSQWLVFLF